MKSMEVSGCGHGRHRDGMSESCGRDPPLSTRVVTPVAFCSPHISENAKVWKHTLPPGTILPKMITDVNRHLIQKTFHKFKKRENLLRDLLIQKTLSPHQVTNITVFF